MVFITDKARQRNSDARKLVCAALVGFNNFDNDHQAKILCIAIALGDSTLEHFSKLLRDKDDIRNTKLCTKLKACLQRFFSFNDDYAEWLPQNLEHLNKGSIDILKDLNPNQFDLVRFSTVVMLNNQKEVNQFNLNISLIVRNAGRPKRTILENAVIKSNQDDVKITLQQFRSIVEIVMTTNIHTEPEKHDYNHVPLHEW